MPGTLAIDLGSTTTVVAWQEERGTPTLLPLPPYSEGDPPVVPSLLWQSHPGHPKPLIGRQVVEAGLAIPHDLQLGPQPNRLWASGQLVSTHGCGCAPESGQRHACFWRDVATRIPLTVLSRRS